MTDASIRVYRFENFISFERRRARAFIELSKFDVPLDQFT